MPGNGTRPCGLLHDRVKDTIASATSSRSPSPQLPMSGTASALGILFSQHVSCLSTQHIGGNRWPGTWSPRENRSIHHSQALRALHSELRIHASILIVLAAHPTTGAGMVSKHLVLEPLPEINRWVWVNPCVRGTRSIGRIPDV